MDASRAGDSSGVPADALGRSPAGIEEERDAAQCSLRAEVEAIVQQMRDEGMTPEKVIVRVKSEVRAACVSGREVFRAIRMTDTIVRDAVRWSIAEYYRTP